MLQHRFYIRLALLACFLMAIPTLAPAQTADDVAGLREQIIRNEELLQRARELVRETSSARARASFATATHLHEQSKKYLQLGAGDGNLALAARLAGQAREAIMQTIALAKREAKLAENAGKAIDRATQRLEQGAQLLSEHPDRSAAAPRKMLDESRSQLDRSRDNMREHLYEAALQLAVSSEQLSTRAVTMLKRDVAGPDLVETELDKTERVLERLAEELSVNADGATRRMYEEALSVQQSAREQFRNQNFQRALDLTQRSRTLAMRAARTLMGRTNAETVERALGLTDGLIAEAANIAAERDQERLKSRVEQARQIQDNARRNFQDGKFDAALRLTNQARSILKDYLSTMATLDADDVSTALTQTDKILERAGEAVAERDDEIARELFARAQDKQARAWEAFEQDQLRAALANTRLARRLARRSVNQLSDNGS